jgi:hypothetical protein
LGFWLFVAGLLIPTHLMTLRDAEGGIFILSFGLESKPRDFDLSLLIEAWARWRQESVIAS